MLIVAFIIVIVVAGVSVFMGTAKFGAMAIGEQLDRIKKSPNYRNGKFQNITFTPDLKEGVSYLTVMRKFFFGKSERSKPSVALPAIVTDLHTLPDDTLVWFGHSSYFIRVDGKNFLVDPVLSGHASPVKFTTTGFTGTNVYSVADIPVVDYLFLSHDHWDHLDYETVLALKPKVKKIITGLGVSAHLQRWGFDASMIIEKDWNEEVVLDTGFVVNTVPARHFSGRGFKRNQSLWLAFVLTTPTMKLFLGGDSGYDTHFAAIGKKFGPFDLAILECGQYNEYWEYIHMMPEQVVEAAIDLQAKRLLPVHWGKFSLSLHSWDEPIIRVTEASRKQYVPIVTPMIGEAVNLKSDYTSKNWWRDIE